MSVVSDRVCDTELIWGKVLNTDIRHVVNKIGDTWRGTNV